ncbi:MAG: hypothetical protein IIT89_00970 [Aeriscardovia sp.]|nr:hypothetical protein [Aeriscardovia sp.]
MLFGVIVSMLSWHWVFFVNVPLGVACFVIVVSSYHEVRRAGEHRTTDYWGVFSSPSSASAC